MIFIVRERKNKKVFKFFFQQCGRNSSNFDLIFKKNKKNCFFLDLCVCV